MLPLDSLLTPAHLHLALNHVPIIGVSVACLPLLIGILFHSRGALASGLLAVLLCVGTMPVIMETGEGAQEAFADGSLSPGMDAAGKAAFREHSGRAKFTAPVAYAAAILALVALLALIKFPRQAAWIGWAVLVGCLLTVALGIWTAEAGGRIRHAEFREAAAAAESGASSFPAGGTPGMPAFFATPPSPAGASAPESPSSPAPSPIPEPSAASAPNPEASVPAVTVPAPEAASTTASPTAPTLSEGESAGVVTNAP